MGSNRKTRKFNHFGAAASALAIVIASAGASASAQETQTRTFDIAAQPLAEALLEYSRQSDVTVIAPTKTTRGLTSRAIAGDMAPDEALDALLGGAALERRERADGAIVLAETDVGGRFRDRSLVRVAQVLDGSGDDRDVAEDDAYLDADEVIVTGTNIRGVENPTVPVLTFDREDIDLSGAATVDDFLRTIPQNFASETQLSTESGNPNNSGRNITQGTSVDLRGLGAGSTLTLLNGRRMTASGQASNVDINVLPLGIIERVDVLTDGATAVYGSDAVGGVINFITRKDFEGFDINARYGTVTEGSKEDFGVGGAGGFNWGSGGIFAGVDYQEAKPLLAEERDFVDLTIAREGATFGSDSERFSVAGGVNQEIGSSIRFGVDVLYTDINSESFSLTNTIPRVSTSDQKALFVNSRIEVDLTDKLEAAFFMDYGRNRVDSTLFFPTTQLGSNADFDNDMFVYEGRLSGQLLDLPGGALSFSLGGLYREEEFNNISNGVLFVSGDRNITAGYAELMVPIFGNQNELPFIQQLQLSLAGRYEDYSDFGDTFDPKVGVYWQVNDALSFRASYSEAFRAPDLASINQEQFFSVTTFPAFFFTSAAPDEFFTTNPVPSYLILLPFGGNPDLEPERARTWSAGFSYEPAYIDGFALEGNYFTISYKDRLDVVNFLDPIQDPAFRSLVAIPPVLTEVEALFARAEAGEITLFNNLNAAPEDVQAVFTPTFSNIAERDVSGFDITISYSKDTDIGRFSAGANASYLIDYIGRASDIAPSSEQVNILYRPVDFRMRGNVSWSNNGFTVFTAINYVDGYRDNIDSSIASTIDAWTTVDLSLAYNTGERFDNVFVDGLRIGFSVTNLFDNDPPFALTPFGINFDSANANPFGRQINFTISKQF